MPGISKHTQLDGKRLFPFTVIDIYFIYLHLMQTYSVPSVIQKSQVLFKIVSLITEKCNSENTNGIS